MIVTRNHTKRMKFVSLIVLSLGATVLAAPLPNPGAAAAAPATKEPCPPKEGELPAVVTAPPKQVYPTVPIQETKSKSEDKKPEEPCPPKEGELPAVVAAPPKQIYPVVPIQETKSKSEDKKPEEPCPPKEAELPAVVAAPPKQIYPAVPIEETKSKSEDKKPQVTAPKSYMAPTIAPAPVVPVAEGTKDQSSVNPSVYGNPVKQGVLSQETTPTPMPTVPETPVVNNAAPTQKKAKCKPKKAATLAQDKMKY
ncbi:MAG: hypothetical protein SGCHY_003553 [Lobulomycetales sp.]